MISNTLSIWKTVFKNMHYNKSYCNGFKWIPSYRGFVKRLILKRGKHNIDILKVQSWLLYSNRWNGGSYTFKKVSLFLQFEGRSIRYYKGKIITYLFEIYFVMPIQQMFSGHCTLRFSHDYITSSNIWTMQLW